MSKFSFGDAVWARLEGYPFWPCRVLEPNKRDLRKLSLESVPPGNVIVWFFNDDQNISVLDEDDVHPFDTKSMHKRTLSNQGKYASQLHEALRQAKRYIREAADSPPAPDQSGSPRHPSPPSITRNQADDLEPEPSTPPRLKKRKSADLSTSPQHPLSDATLPEKKRKKKKRRTSDDPSHSKVKRKNKPKPRTDHTRENKSTTPHPRHRASVDSVASPKLSAPSDYPRPSRRRKSLDHHVPPSSPPDQKREHPQSKRQRRPSPQPPATPPPPHSPQHSPRCPSEPSHAKSPIRSSPVQDFDAVDISVPRKSIRKPHADSKPAEAPSRSPSALRPSCSPPPSPPHDAKRRPRSECNIDEPDHFREITIARAKAFSSYNKDQCVELVFEKQADLRFKNVKLWHSGLRLHGPGKIITSEHELLEACEPAIEKVNALMEWASSNAGKSTRALKRFRTLERQAVDGGKALYEVYFDINLSLRGIGRELLSVAKALTPYSREAATVFRDLIVLWSDLMNPENLEEELSRRQVQTPELFQLDAEERRENLSDDRTPPRRLRTSEGSSPPIVKQKGETDEKTEVRTTSSSSKEVQSPVLQEKPVAPSPNKKEQSAKKKKLVNLDRMMHAISTMMKPLTEADLGLKFGTEELKDFVARLEVAVSSEAKSTSKSTGLSVYDTGLKYARAIQKLMKAYDAASGDLDKFRASPLASHFLAILKSGNSRSAFTAFSAAL